MSVTSAAALAILAAVSVNALKEHNKTAALVLSAFAACALMILCVSPIKNSFDNISEALKPAPFKEGWTDILLKSLGICLVCEFASDVCKDMGQQGLSGAIELFGRVTVIILSLPIFESIISAVFGLI